VGGSEYGRETLFMCGCAVCEYAVCMPVRSPQTQPQYIYTHTQRSPTQCIPTQIGWRTGLAGGRWSVLADFLAILVLFYSFFRLESFPQDSSLRCHLSCRLPYSMAGILLFGAWMSGHKSKFERKSNLDGSFEGSDRSSLRRCQHSCNVRFGDYMFLTLIRCI